jgi:Domain of unknown function DUF29
MPPMSRIATSDPAPVPEAGRPLYETDLHAWAVEQARLLRDGRFDLIDAENIAEEILDVARTEYRVLESALRVVLIHMLKWDHQPERRSRSWENTIQEHRNRVRDQLADNPSLKPRQDEAVERAYRDARLRASSETGMDVGRFPETCPYDWDAIMERGFERPVER